MMDLTRASLLLAYASYANAQYGHGSYSSGNNPYSSGSGSSSSGSGSSSYASQYFSQYSTTLIAHAVLATLAFGFLFPVGGIIIRIASFPGLWWVHGVFQTFAYILYIAAFALGLQMVSSAPAQAGVWKNAHPIIGVVLFVVLFFQPILGFLHHVMFKKHSRRVIWSYGHIWLGRAAITLGIINGGLGLLWAQQTGFYAPPKGAVIGYAVVAGLIWLLYVASIIYGESKRKRNSAKGDIVPPKYEGARRSGRRSGSGRRSRRGSKHSGRHEMTQYA